MNWELVDKELAIYLKTYNIKQKRLIDNIQNLFNIKYENINSRISDSELNRFKRYLEDNEELIRNNQYVAYMVSKYLKKTRITYKELLKVGLYVEYAKFEQNISIDQLETLTNINENVLEETIGKCKKLGFVPRKKLKLLDDMLLYYLALPNNLGVTYQEQNDTNAIYGADEVYKQAIIDISTGKEPNVDNNKYRDIFARQQRREINKKKDNNQQDKLSGYIDNQDTYLMNQIIVEVMGVYGVERVIFKAITDKRSTLMCQTLNGQKFYLNKMNTYSRYSKADDKNIIYNTKGMVVGENLPPISNGFHYCRSWVEPIKENE